MAWEKMKEHGKMEEKAMIKFMNIFAAALIMLAAVGCEKHEALFPDDSSNVITLSATTNHGVTKTSLGDLDTENNEYPVLWSEGDAIAVVNNNQLFKFVVNAADAGKTQGTFTCTEGEGFDAAKPIQAFYPFDGVTYQNSTISYTVPATQTYQENSFGQGAMPMAAYAANASDVVSFVNLFGVVKLQLKGNADEKVSSIEIFSSNSVSGTSALTINESARSINLSSTSASAKKVVLDCGTDGVALNTTDATEFLITVPAGATGLRIVINTTQASYYKEIPSQNEQSEPINVITVGKILKMPVLNIAEMTSTYVENGVDYGSGIALPASGGGTIIWAPVNCGYDSDHRYGLLYQWGRKYGQGYGQGNQGESPAAQIENVEENLKYAAEGSSEENRNKFFYNVTNWLTTNEINLWYSADDSGPIKTDYDPCPPGWRVPTNAELLSLLNGLTESSSKSNLTSQWTAESNDSYHSSLPGFWFYGNTTQITGNNVFFPAAGYREYQTGGIMYLDNNQKQIETRGTFGCYWSSTATNDNTNAWLLEFTNSGGVTSKSNARAYGYSVRCVKCVKD